MDTESVDFAAAEPSLVGALRWDALAEKFPVAWRFFLAGALLDTMGVCNGLGGMRPSQNLPDDRNDFNYTEVMRVVP